MRAANITLRSKDLLGIDHLSPEEITLILDTAEGFKEVSERPVKKVPALRGQLVINLFMEASTRTRVSFEIAEKRLSADTLNFSASGSSVEKGETLIDTAQNLMAMHPDMIVIRHKHPGAPKMLADRLPASIINAGDGAHGGGGHAPRPHEPRRGDRIRRRRWTMVRDSGSGDQRRGRSHGCAVFARGSACCRVNAEC